MEEIATPVRKDFLVKGVCCNVCGKSNASHAESNLKAYRKQVEYLRRLKVDEYWLDVLRCEEEDDYYLICMSCWLTFVNTAVNCTSFCMKRQSSASVAENTHSGDDDLDDERILRCPICFLVTCECSS